MGGTRTTKSDGARKKKVWVDLEEKKRGMERQKAKVRWLKEGDENSKLFYAAIRYKERRNTIRGLEINGVWEDDPSHLKSHLFGVYKTKFSNITQGCPKFRSDRTKKLSQEEADFIERPFEEEEIWRAVKECGSGKSPGPDGFTAGFVKKFWNILKEDLVKALHWFWQNESISLGCNSSFITLIPKCSNPETLGTLDRLVSLVCTIK